MTASSDLQNHLVAEPPLQPDVREQRPHGYEIDARDHEIAPQPGGIDRRQAKPGRDERQMLGLKEGDLPFLSKLAGPKSERSAISDETTTRLGHRF